MFVMNSSTRRSLASATGCEILFDDLTRQLYATDASIYQIVPEGVAMPRGADEASALLRVAADAGVGITPRGAGSGLAGGAVGSGLIVDFARHNQGVSDLDVESRVVRVGAGVVLDQLNAFLAPHGLCFGPDVATSSRATIGGMIANNSSGARAPIYGTTADHLRSVEVVLADGRVANIGLEFGELDSLDREVRVLIEAKRAEIEARLPGGGFKRCPGYGFDRYLQSPDLKHIVASSEGSLVGITSAVLELSPLPREKGLAVILFASIEDAMQATVEISDLKPAAIEHVDRVLFDQTRGRPAFLPARELLGLDEAGIESFLIVEFYGETRERLEALRKRDLGVRTLVLEAPEEKTLVWGLRKAGLTLLTSRKGAVKPVTGIEDVAVSPERLPDYVRELRGIFGKETQASFYGHAASGLLHVRPLLDLRDPAALRRFRELGDVVSRLAQRFEASFAAEHGLGIARTAYLKENIGEELFDLSRAVKARFDPRGVMNPGKVIDDGSFHIDRNLRKDGAANIELSFEPILAFSARDASFVGNLEQCNGCGGCLKSEPTMCPTYVATGDEVMSTRGRANTIRAVLEGRIDNGGLSSSELDVALDNCLSCKACKRECPSNVDMALLKAELLHAKHRVRGTPLSARIVASVDLAGRIGCSVAPIANFLMSARPTRWLFEKLAGLDAGRELPPYTSERFDHWFDARDLRSKKPSSRGRVILWDDTFVRYHEPGIGQAAVQVLEAAGYEVTLPYGRACCGRPAFSVGCLDRARAWGRINVELLASQPEVPILFLEPSCHSMFIQDYEELGIAGAGALASRCYLFEEFVDDLLEHDAKALHFSAGDGDAHTVTVHAHCHTKALADPGVQLRLLQRIPLTEVDYLQAGCCGMAGSFGMMKKTSDLSRQVAEPLVELVEARDAETPLIASGTSCRHQISGLTGREPVHLAEFLARALAGP